MLFVPKLLIVPRNLAEDLSQDPVSQEDGHSCLAVASQIRQVGSPVLLISRDFAILLGNSHSAVAGIPCVLPAIATVVAPYRKNLPIVWLARIRTIAYDEVVGLLKRNCGERLDTSRWLVKIAIV